MPKGVKLTKKQKGFVKDYLATGNATEAAARNYDVENRHTAQTMGAENLLKPVIQLSVNEAFPDEELFKLHREGLYDEELNVRWKYLDGAYKLKGSFAPEKRVNLNISQTNDSKLDAIVAQIEQQLDEPEGTTISP